MKVGDTIWLRPLNNAARRNAEPVSDTITKIGKKYFYCALNGRFYLDSLKQDCGQYSSNYIAYLSYDDLMAELLRNKLCTELQYIAWHKLTLSQLQSINKIINNEN